MTENHEKENRSDVNVNLPNVVGLAAVLTIIGSVFLIFEVIYFSGLILEGFFTFAYAVLLFAIGFELFFLEKWAYWGFLVVATFGCLNIVADFLLVTVDMSPSTEILIIQIIWLPILVMLVAYFLSSAVREAFGAKRLW